MPVTVTMPQLGESVTEGTIGKWLKQPGDPVAKYESIAEVISDKVNAEIPAPADGVMGEHIAQEGAVVAVGEPICSIESGAAEASGPAEQQPAASAATGQGSEIAPGAETAATQQGDAGPPPPQNGNGAAPAQPQPAAPPQPVAQQPQPQPQQQSQPQQPQPQPQQPVAQQQSAPRAGDDLHMTPAVRMLIREHGVDPAEIQGSGIAGRITKKDVLEYVQRRDAGAPAVAPQPQTAPAPQPQQPARVQQPAAAAPQPQPSAPQQTAGERDTVVPLNPIRRLIAEHMVRSKATSPHAWLMVEVDMTGVVALRSRMKADYQRRYGVNLTYLPIIARVVCDVLRQFPNFNATWSDEGIIQRGEVNLGIAVALEDNLVVPVIRNADSLSVSGLAQAFDDVAQRARGNRLRVDDLQGGTFTLNNTGALGLVATAAIINQPQAAILTTDAIVKRPVVMPGDLIGIRSMMNLCMSLDHRINDGLQGARFLNAVKQRLEAMDAGTQL